MAAGEHADLGNVVAEIDRITEWRRHVNVDDKLKSRYRHLVLDDLPFGFECGDGWLDIIHAFFATAEEAVAAGGGTFHLRQIKEKMGSLRISFRTAGLPQEAVTAIDEAYRLAEARSFQICEHCGRRGRLSYNGRSVPRMPPRPTLSRSTSTLVKGWRSSSPVPPFFMTLTAIL